MNRPLRNPAESINILNCNCPIFYWAHFPLQSARSCEMRQSRGKEIIEFPMRHTYELTFIVRVDPNEEVINNSVTQVQGWVEANELGQVTKIDRWGRRKLAYE